MSQVKVYNKETGQERSVDTIDRTELLATGRWTTERPEKSFDEEFIEGIRTQENPLSNEAYNKRELAFKDSEDQKLSQISVLQAELTASQQAQAAYDQREVDYQAELALKSARIVELEAEIEKSKSKAKGNK